METLAEIYCVEKLNEYTLPLTYQKIEKHQREYKELVTKLKHAKCHIKYFCGGRITTQLIFMFNKIVMPTILQK